MVCDSAVVLILQEVCAVDSRGWQVVHYAAQQGMVRLVGALLDSGADPEAHDGKLKLTPLMIGSSSNATGHVTVM